MAQHGLRVAVAADARCPSLAALPLPLLERCFALLPVDARARAACVCPGWCDALANVALWTRLDLSHDSGVSRALDADALLRGAARRAYGQLSQIDLGRCQADPYLVRAVLAANVGSLREMRIGDVNAVLSYVFKLAIDEIVAAAPQLQVLDASVFCDWEDAPPLMSATDARLAPLRLHGLAVVFARAGDHFGGIARVGLFAATLANAVLQPALSHVHIAFANTRQLDVMDALVNAVLARRLGELTFERCTTPAAAPLARLLVGGTLHKLKFDNSETRGQSPLTGMVGPLFDAAGATLVADALRATTTLTALDLRSADASVFSNAHVQSVVLGALVGHQSLRVLKLQSRRESRGDQHPRGAAIAALVAADAPALQELHLCGNALGNAGLAELVDALPHNRNLRLLDISDNRVSERFLARRLLPAVRANTGLQQLKCKNVPVPGVAAGRAAAERAQDLVRSRPRRS